jgi:FAD:protein FMN transferase
LAVVLSTFVHVGRRLRGSAWFFFGLVSLALILSGCPSAAPPPPITREAYVLGTFVTISAHGPNAETAIDAAYAEFNRVEERMSRFRPESEIGRVNENAGLQPVQVSEDTLHVVRTALDYGDRTGGAFDITVGPLLEVWGFGNEPQATRFNLPSQFEIDAARALVGYEKLEITDAGEIYLPQRGMMLDLGGIAKGYALERAADAMRGAGVDGALINAGGSVKAIGNRPNGQPWRVGIQHPREADGILGIVPMADGEVVITSGDYQRYFEVDGRRYHHIVDPATGFPAQELLGVSLVGQDAFVADILSTAVFVVGLEEGQAMIEAENGFGIVAMTPDEQLHVTPALAERGEFSP